MTEASAGRKKLDVVAAGRAAAIAINRRRLAFALTIGAAILATLVRRAIASGMSAFLFFVSHYFDSPFDSCWSVRALILAVNLPAAHAFTANGGATQGAASPSSS